jgi:hypothetical protein
MNSPHNLQRRCYAYSEAVLLDGFRPSGIRSQRRLWYAGSRARSTELLHEQKIQLLRAWQYDATSVAVAEEEGMIGSNDLLVHYKIPVLVLAPPPLPANMAWAFLRTEYGECFDSFFAFGLFAIAKDSGFFAPALVNLFEPVMQEEARHILFFVNWLVYQRTQLPWWRRIHLSSHCVGAMTLQEWSRIQTARGMSKGDFSMKGHEAILPDLSLREFLQLCLRENERRLSRYDR